MSVPSAFEWRDGQNPENSGIWIYSEVFTYDYENGEKVAILLLDTQELSNDTSNLSACFVLSMLVSSVQLYNVMSIIEERDLNKFDIFSEYAKIVQQQENEKPFQSMLSIVRDWPSTSEETSFGWSGQRVIDQLLTENEKQTDEQRQLRKAIESSFNEISAFLLPHPGSIVAQARNNTIYISQINTEFRMHVKDLVLSIFAPDNLVAKKINGENIRARDLVQYFQSYARILNGNELPGTLMIHQVCYRFACIMSIESRFQLLK